MHFPAEHPIHEMIRLAQRFREILADLHEWTHDQDELAMALDFTSLDKAIADLASATASLNATISNDVSSAVSAAVAAANQSAAAAQATAVANAVAAAEAADQQTLEAKVSSLEAQIATFTAAAQANAAATAPAAPTAPTAPADPAAPTS